MKRAIQLLFYAVSLLVAMALCVGVAFVAYGFTTEPAAMFITVLGWVAVGLGWQRLTPWLQAKLKI